MATSTEAISVAKVPGRPSEEKRLYKVRYRRGNNPDCWSLFYFREDLTAAIVAARDWCIRNDFRFIHVELALIELNQSGD